MNLKALVMALLILSQPVQASIGFTDVNASWMSDTWKKVTKSVSTTASNAWDSTKTFLRDTFVPCEAITAEAQAKRSDCQQKAITPQQLCVEAGFVGPLQQGVERCSASTPVDRLPQAECIARQEVWENGHCVALVGPKLPPNYNPPQPDPPMDTPQSQCTNSGYYWAGGECWQSSTDYQMEACYNNGNNWYNGKCLTDSQLEQEQCRVELKGYWAENDCWASQEDYNIDKCYSNGKTWYAGKCTTEIEAKRTICAEEGGQLQTDDEMCYTSESVAEVCQESTGLWVESEGRCYVSGNTMIPRGLEKFYFIVKTPQEKAMYGAYRDALTLALYKQEESLRQALANKDAEIQDLLDKEISAIEAEYESALAELERALESQGDDYEAALKEYEDALGDLQATSSFLNQRLEMSQYGGSMPPSGSLGALKNMVGTGNGNVQLTYPSGFPTPTQSQDGTYWIASVPVKVVFPKLVYEDASITYRAESLMYEFSSDGGRNFQAGEMALDFEGDAATGGSVQVKIQARIPKGASTYDLELRSGLVYYESYVFGDDRSYELPSFREATPLERTFYTGSNPISNPFTANGQAASSVQAYEADDPAQEPEGSHGPGGAAQAYNAVAEQRSEYSADAGALDQNTGLGLRLLVDNIWIVALLVGAVAAYFAGFLDWFGPIKKLRNRKSQPKEEDPFGLAGLGEI